MVEVHDMKVEQAMRADSAEESAQQRETEEGAWQRSYVEELRGGICSPRAPRTVEQLGLPLASSPGTGGKPRRLPIG